MVTNEMDLSKFALIIGILLSLINIAHWSRKYFNGAYRLKRKKEDLQKEVGKHKNEINELKITFGDVLGKFDTLYEIMKIQIRYSIVSACNEAIENKEVDQYQLQAIEDMYTVYTDVLHANSYVSTLVHKVRKLPLSNID
jgi:hypothetical protein